ncbi:type VI secretion system-associated protein TagF [Amaricoccus sp.]|uniref:type VI secretion system-associated protein TagF n=1 Tax=Amaricoccus sp. TaxID=1872485 RepID=UPI001B5DA1A4|nr:type VI secretion system-associated protein TagF [Amaricoccus sp.]MBP7000315.1 type VI secretion system-associated protein TagF [Amaricoccus sp.]
MTGFFGKIPASGDFVSWNLPRSFTDRWDCWFSAELLARPDVGPLDPRAWRFVVPAGVFGDQPVAGVWRMSEDRAGRRYPFVIARLGETPDPGDAWYGHIEGALDAAVAGSWAPNFIAEDISRHSADISGSLKAPRIFFWSEGSDVVEVDFRRPDSLMREGLAFMRARVPDEEDV